MYFAIIGYHWITLRSYEDKSRCQLTDFKYKAFVKTSNDAKVPYIEF